MLIVWIEWNYLYDLREQYTHVDISKVAKIELFQKKIETKQKANQNDEKMYI